MNMKRVLHLSLICAIGLTLATVVAAENKEPVVRMGNWIEIGDDAWFDIIGNIDIRLKTTHNADVEDDVRDATDNFFAGTDSSISSSADQERSDVSQDTEVRFGANFKFGQTLRSHILFEIDQIFDEDIIDGSGNGTDQNRPNLERYWIDFKWPNSPFRARIGAELFAMTQARQIRDDIPGWQFFLEFDDFDIWARIFIESEALKLGLGNDNDNIIYNFGANYTAMKGHKFQFDVIYFRFRFDQDQDTDIVHLVPSWTGRMGLLETLLEFNLALGTIEANGDPAGRDNYDVMAWSVIAKLDLNFGKVRPFIGFVLGSGDDDGDDGDITGFTQCPRDCASFNSGKFAVFNNLFSVDDDIAPPARPDRAAYGGSSNATFSHEGDSPYRDGISNAVHENVSTRYSNPGTLMIPVGVHVFPWKGHKMTLLYNYVQMLESDTIEDTIEAQRGVSHNRASNSVDEVLYHEVVGVWEWKYNKHFDIRLTGEILLPGEGSQDIAELSFRCGPAGSETNDIADPDAQCEGEDPALYGEVRVRARF